MLGRQNGKMVGGHRDGKERRREEADQNQVQDFKDNARDGLAYQLMPWAPHQLQTDLSP